MTRRAAMVLTLLVACTSTKPDEILGYWDVEAGAAPPATVDAAPKTDSGVSPPTIEPTPSDASADVSADAKPAGPRPQTFAMPCGTSAPDDECYGFWGPGQSPNATAFCLSTHTDGPVDMYRRCTFGCTRDIKPLDLDPGLSKMCEQTFGGKCAKPNGLNWICVAD